MFNDYRLTQLETWTQTQDKPETREYFKGLKWFLYHRRKYQQNFIDLVKHSGQDVAHNKAYELTIGHNELAFEYYFRSIETMIQTIETHHNSVVRLDPDNSDKENYIQLLCTLFTNDQLFFIKYCHDFHLFHDKFPLIRKHIELLTSGMFKDYRLSRD